MFISQLYEGSISDKQIVKRSGFLETLKKKLRQENSTREIQLWQIKALILAMILIKLIYSLTFPLFSRTKQGLMRAMC